METKGIERTADGPVAVRLGKSHMALEIDLTLYDLEAIFRTCYLFTDRCYLFLARPKHPRQVLVTLGSKSDTVDLDSLAGDFCNELIDQQLRGNLARQAGPVRELLLAQAFAEGNLLDPNREDGDYDADPFGIGVRR